MSLSPSSQLERFRELIQEKRREIRKSREMTNSQASLTPDPSKYDYEAPQLSTDATLVNPRPSQNKLSFKTSLNDVSLPSDSDTENDEIVETIEPMSNGNNDVLPRLPKNNCPQKRNQPEVEGLFIASSAGDSFTTEPVTSSSLSRETVETQAHIQTEVEAKGKSGSIETDGKLIREEDINIKKPILQSHLASLGRIPKRKKPYGETKDGEPIPSPFDQCPVRNQCPHIPKGRIDCRTYAPLPRDQSQRREYTSFHKVNFEKRNDRKLSSLLEFSLCQKKLEDSRHEDVEEAISNFHRWIDKMRFFEMNQALCDNSKIVPKLKYFLSSTYPFKDRITPELRDDITIFKHRWRDSDFDPDVHRGITHRQLRNDDVRRLSKRLNQDYEHLKSHCFYGMGKLVNGQCWLNQLELLRDGVHGKTEGGIDGDTETGARSIILSCPERRDDYADRDMGDVVYYVGTSRGDDEDESEQDGDTRRATHATQILFASLKSENPIRVIRSWRLPEISRRRPRDGFRLDGLYKAEAVEVIDVKYAVYRFKLIRLPGQTQIRTELPNERQLREFETRRLQEESIRKESVTCPIKRKRTNIVGERANRQRK